MFFVLFLVTMIMLKMFMLLITLNELHTVCSAKFSNNTKSFGLIDIVKVHTNRIEVSDLLNL